MDFASGPLLLRPHHLETLSDISRASFWHELATSSYNTWGNVLLIKPFGNVTFPSKTSPRRGSRKEIVMPRQSSFFFFSYLWSHHYCTTVTSHLYCKCKGPNKQWQLTTRYHREGLLRAPWVTLNSPCLCYAGRRLLLGQMYSNCDQSQPNPSKHCR